MPRSVRSWEKIITKDHTVDSDNVFAGTGVARFDLQPSLNAGEVISFVVLSSSTTDASYDATALKFVISASTGTFRVSLPEEFPLDRLGNV
jgi:hypothetical protein